MYHNMITRDSSREEIRVYGNRRDLWGVDFRSIRDKRRPDGEQLPESERVGVVREVELDLSIVSFHPIPPLRPLPKKNRRKRTEIAPPSSLKTTPCQPLAFIPIPFPPPPINVLIPTTLPQNLTAFGPGTNSPIPHSSYSLSGFHFLCNGSKSIGEFLLCETVPGCGRGRDDGGSGGCGAEKDFGFVEGLD